jgi:hypothetical protein
MLSTVSINIWLSVLATFTVLRNLAMPVGWAAQPNDPKSALSLWTALMKLRTPAQVGG